MARILIRLRRFGVLAVTLGLMTALVPDSGRVEAQYALIKVSGVHGVDAADHTVWILALGSDARPGQSVLRSRADAIQLVGINAKTHHAVVIGIPRDSYVAIPGHGSDKINASMVAGGPASTARAVAGVTGINPDYVFVTSFGGMIQMVDRINGIDAKVTYFMNGLGVVLRPGIRHLNGNQALSFARIRYGLPRGDFDRSMDQGQLLKGGLATVSRKSSRPGYIEHALGVFAKYTETNLDPVSLYRLGRTVLEVNPRFVSTCVLRGGTGMAGSASVVFLDLGHARALGADVRNDARLNRGC